MNNITSLHPQPPSAFSEESELYFDVWERPAFFSGTGNGDGLPKTVIRAIQRLLANGRSHRTIAELYGVSRETITAIHNGRTSGSSKEKT